MENGWRRVNIVQILCTHIFKWKMIPFEITLQMGGEGDKEWSRGWIQLQYIWYIVRTFINATVYPHSAQEKKKSQPLWK
jgi:hypothetical protein